VFGPGLVAQQPTADSATPPTTAGKAGSERRLNWPSAWTSEVINGGAGDSSKVPEPVAAPAVGDGATVSEATRSPPPPAEAAAAPVAVQPAGQSPAAQAGAAVATPAPQAGAAAPGPAPQPQAAQPAAAAAQTATPVPVELKAQVAKDVEAGKSIGSQLESLSKSVERLKDRDEELSVLLPSIEKLIAGAKATGTKLQPALADVRSQIEKLGPVPGEGASEADEIAAERKRLNATAAEIDGAIKSSELTEVRGRQLITRIQEILLENFRSGLSERTSSVLSPAVWRDGLALLPKAAAQLHAVFREWMGRAEIKLPTLLGWIAVALLIAGGLQIVSRRTRVSLRQQIAAGTAQPTFSQRSLVASLEALMRGLPKIVLAAILLFGLYSTDLLYLQMEGIAGAVFKAVAIAATGLAFTSAYLQPGRKQWRVIDLGDPASWRARRVVRVGVFVFAIDVVVRQFINELALPLQASILWTSLVALAFAAIFVTGARIKLAVPEAGNARLALLGGHVHKVPLLIAAVAILIAVLTGYVALGHLIATRLLVLAAAFFLLTIFYIANRAIAREPDQYLQGSSDLGGTAGGLPLDIRRKVARALSIVLDIVLFLIAVPVVLTALGFSRPEISTLVKQAVFGFQVGGVEISLFRVGMALVMFAGIVFASRMLQRWLGDTVLHPSRTEQGLGNSIRTGVGYLGFMIAAIAGLSYAGLDITNLAIVAGALSVGIGFGLQSIVNNFVSGLILLVERPIKVGDWIKVGELQGHVRKISVRSAEIETFERASVIIPNSELISGTVINLTLRNALGRISIPVGVSYDSDPEEVQRLLLECARESQLVARHPAAFVVFDNFGASSLDFSLRIFVSDVSTSLSAQTQVRKAIIAKFREAGIDIPYPQQDLNVRDIDGLKAALLQVLEDRRGAAAGSPTVAPTTPLPGQSGGGTV